MMPSRSSVCSWVSVTAAALLLIGCATQKRTDTSANPTALTPAAEKNETSKSAESNSVSGWPSFDGKTLHGWSEADYAGRGEVKVEEGKVILGAGYMTGIRWNGAVPQFNYEVSLDAMRVDGSDFFCGLTFPVGTNVCSFIAGGWGGGVTGLSSIDGEDAANNNTTGYMNFENGRWYNIRVRVTEQQIQAWIDNDKVVDQELEEHKISIRIEMEACTPFGVATYSTTGALKNLEVKKL